MALWLWIAYGAIGVLNIALFVREWRRITAKYKRDLTEMEARHRAAEAEIAQWKANVLAHLDQ